MEPMDRKVQMRLKWVNLYEEYGEAGLVCRRCGISRPTLRKWARRYKEEGINGLQDQSHRPHSSPSRKVNKKHEKWILDLRTHRKMGARRIQNELKRLYGYDLSLATIHKVLIRNQVRPIIHRRRKNTYKRYERPIPGDRIQMDTCKIAPGYYQYTAIDDCTRYKVTSLSSRRTAANTLEFLDKVIEEMPFPIQRIQTDRGNEFFAYKVQERFMEYGIKFRPIKPGSPHLNGKVERVQRTVLDEFYSTVNLKSNDLEDQLQEWQHFYNWHRPHGSLKGKTPIDKLCEKLNKTPLTEEIEVLYDPSKERFRHQNYRQDLALRKLKRSM